MQNSRQSLTWNFVSFFHELILFLEMHAIAHAHRRTHTSKFTCAIYCKRKIVVFSLLVLLLLYISCKKFFIERFFIEDYVKEIENVINYKIL